MALAEISKITLPSGTSYLIKDAAARDAISKINSFEYVMAKDASTTPEGITWKVNDLEVTGALVASAETQAKIYLVPAKNLTNDSRDEYITVTEDEGMTYRWEKFGNTDVNLADLGALAFKDVAAGPYTPAGTVSQPSFTGDALVSSGKMTPAGTVSQPTFTGMEGDVSVQATPSGSITIGDKEDANYTPTGTVSKPTVTVVPTVDNTGYMATTSDGGGSVTAGTASQCVLPTLETTVSDETLLINWSEGSFTQGTPTAVTLPTFTNKSVVTGIESAEASQPTFTGNGVDLEFVGTNMVSTGKFTPDGTVSQPSFAGNEIDISVTGTPSGTVSQPTFSGTAGSVTVS